MVLGGKRTLKITEFHQTWLLHHCPPETFVHMEYKWLKIRIFFSISLIKAVTKLIPLKNWGKDVVITE